MKHEIDLEELRKGGVVKLKDKDMFSVWVRAVCDNMAAVKLRRVAEIAERYGRGIVLFTTRQFPIIPHIHFKDIGAVKEELQKVELMLDRCGARVRNADVCYDKNICPYAVLDPIGLGEKLDQFWREDQGGFKIKISIVGCARQCTAPRVLADVAFVGAKRAGKTGFDAYVGGKLGLDPLIGIKMAELLSEEQSLKFMGNFLELIRTAGRAGERAAALIRRLGEQAVKTALTKDLKLDFKNEPFKCETRPSGKAGEKILRIRATNGEANSEQVRKIADLAERFGLGFIHFPVRGGPEIPGVRPADFEPIRKELNAVGLALLDKGIDNLQSCFGGYCTNGIINVQDFLRKVEKIVEKIGLNNLNIKISASGCPNSCAISHLSDLGYLGAVEPEVDVKKCTGCGICPKACRVKAIETRDQLAVIDPAKCKNCGQCVKACPFDAIKEKRQGLALLAGGYGSHFIDDDYPGEVRLAEELTNFLSEAAALEITERILVLVKENNKNVGAIIDKIGLEKFKEAVL